MHILSYVHSPWPADSEHDMYKENTDRCWLQQAHEHLERKTRTFQVKYFRRVPNMKIRNEETRK